MMENVQCLIMQSRWVAAAGSVVSEKTSERVEDALKSWG
jgi:hypothetical protein